jgi:hypothetical protein
MIAAGLWKDRRLKPVHQPRYRRECLGELNPDRRVGAERERVFPFLTTLPRDVSLPSLLNRRVEMPKIITIGSIFVLPFLVTAVQAGDGRPGCMNSCLTKCYAAVPSQYKTVAECVADWAPRNLAREEAVRKAKQQSGRN